MISCVAEGETAKKGRKNNKLFVIKRTFPIHLIQIRFRQIVFSESDLHPRQPRGDLFWVAHSSFCELKSGEELNAFQIIEQEIIAR